MKKICVVSGTRADYGLLYWTMKEIQKSTELKLQVIATCMHLDSKFGETWKNFQADGFPIDKKLSLGELLDSRSSVIDQVSTGLKGFFEAFNELKPDLILILGDRYDVMNPGATISGNVTIGDGNLLGTGSTILQNLSISNNNIIGGNGLLSKNVLNDKVMIGVPCKELIKVGN